MSLSQAVIIGSQLLVLLQLQSRIIIENSSLPINSGTPTPPAMWCLSYSRPSGNVGIVGCGEISLSSSDPRLLAPMITLQQGKTVQHLHSLLSFFLVGSAASIAS